MSRVQESMGEGVLENKTKYVLDYNETCDFEISRMYDDMRGAFEYEADQWVDDKEPLFTLSEIYSLFQDLP